MTLHPLRHPAAEVCLDNVSKSCAGGSLHAVRDVSLSIRAGEVFGILGRSGAGINLLKRPDTGPIFLGQQGLNDMSKQALRHVRQSIGILFQQFHRLQNARVFENITLPLRIHDWVCGAIKGRVLEVLEFVELSDKIDADPTALSGSHHRASLRPVRQTRRCIAGLKQGTP